MAMLEAMKPLKIRSVGQREQKAAAKLLRNFSDQDLTLADAVGLHVMTVREIKDCWSTDFHLGLTGATLAIHRR